MTVQCENCGARHQLTFDVTSNPGHGCLSVSAKIPDEEFVWLRLFAEAHTGAFR